LLHWLSRAAAPRRSKDRGVERPWPAIDLAEPRFALAFGATVEERAAFFIAMSRMSGTGRGRSSESCKLYEILKTSRVTHHHPKSRGLSVGRDRVRHPELPSGCARQAQSE
jgi:hypothetical protein